MSTHRFYASEPIVSVVLLQESTGEMVSAPLLLGHYGPNGAGEVWIEQEGRRVQIPACHFKAFLAELKHTHQMAQDAKEPTTG